MSSTTRFTLDKAVAFTLADAESPIVLASLLAEFVQGAFEAEQRFGVVFQDVAADRADEPLSVSVDVVVGGRPALEQLVHFRRLGGFFGLRVPSGALALDTYPAFEEAVPQRAGRVSVSPGHTRLHLYEQKIEEERWSEALRERVGQKEHSFIERVDSLATVSCFLWLPLVIFALLKLSWPMIVSVGLWALIKGANIVLKRTPAYRRVVKEEKAMRDTLASFILVLEEDESTMLPGGVAMIYPSDMELD